MLAYVQIAVEPNKDTQVFEALKNIPEVREVHILFGDWDVMAKVEMGDPEELGALIVAKIRAVPGVRHTKTLIVAR